MNTITKYILIGFAVLFCIPHIDIKEPQTPLKIEDKKLLTDLKCMEKNLYHEARGEPIAGIIAVGHVTMNRTKSEHFPSSVCEVVYQPKQFSWVYEKPITPSVIPLYIKQIAYDLVVSKKLKDNTGGSLFFHAKWVKPFKRTRQVAIGNHIFYS